jgi:hypothetical protein
MLLKISENINLKGSPGLLRDIPIARIQPQSFGEWEWLLKREVEVWQN